MSSSTLLRQVVFNPPFLAVPFGSFLQHRSPPQVVVLDLVVLCRVLFDKVGGFLVVSLHQVLHLLVVLLLKFHKGLLLF